MSKGTIFENAYETEKAHYVDVNNLLKRIKDGKSKDRVLSIRKKVAAGEDYGIDKKNLPSVIFSGEATKAIEKTYKSGKKKGQKYLSKREDDSITKHSGFFVLDFDDINVENKKSQLSNDKYIYAAWVSPSGKGVKALAKCPAEIENHEHYYEAFIDRYPELDTTSRNIARLCFESYDPDIYINYHSEVWNKKKSKQERKKQKEAVKRHRNNRVMSVAVDMIRSAIDGEKHNTLIKAANLLGGYIQVGQVDETEATQILEQEIQQKNIKDFDLAQKTIKDGIEHGKTRPIREAKEIEKKHDVVSDFLAENSDMDEYLYAYINGTIEMGLSTGIHNLNNHWLIKRNHLVWVGGADNVGKTVIVWYLAVLAALFNGYKFLIFSAENNDGQIKKKLIELVINEKVTAADKEKIEWAKKFVEQHFRIVTNRNMFTWENFLKNAEIVYDEGFDYDVLIAEPYNAMDIPKGNDKHTHDIKTLNLLRVFKENYSAVWVCDHAVSSATREKDDDGYIKRPYKSSIDGGQMKANKVDDFLILHRLVNHPEEYMVNQIHVDKIKDTDTGGKPTMKDEPVRITANKDLCGFSCGMVDPVEKWWEKKEAEEKQSGIQPNEEFEGGF